MAMVGHITGEGNTPLTVYLAVMGNECIHCRQPCNGHYRFMALGPPYCGMLHTHCAPFYTYSGSWPHPHPAVTYGTQPAAENPTS